MFHLHVKQFYSYLLSKGRDGAELKHFAEKSIGFCQLLIKSFSFQARNPGRYDSHYDKNITIRSEELIENSRVYRRQKKYL